MRQKQADPGPRQANSLPVEDGGASWRFRNWRVPTRLTAILLVPVLTGLSFAGVLVKDQLDLASQAGQNEKVAELVRDATKVVTDLENERDISTAPQLAGDRDDAAISAAQRLSNADIQTMLTAAKSVTMDDRIEAALGGFETLETNQQYGLQAVRAGNNATMDPPTTELDYTHIFLPLLGLDNELSFGNADVNSRGRELYALSLEKASTSDERDLVTIALAMNQMPLALAEAIGTADELTDVSESQYVVSGIPSDLALYKNTVTAPELSSMEDELSGPRYLNTRVPLSGAGETIKNWDSLATPLFDQEGVVESTITDEIVQDAQDAKNSADQQAALIAGEALAALLASALLTMVMARSMVRGMRTLRDSAQGIASERLPDLVRKLSKTDPERVDTTVEPIPLNGRDEIGEVARAFDDVHREAIRLASEQALLRGNVNAIFTNLSRRSQGLIERQLALITDLENNEADPDQLESLFKLDHLATRMRRNGENLLVLAGESAGREWTDPIPLVDVLRAAASEVEQYERIELSGIPETEVIGVAVNDLVHLLAELLENATSFSSPQTKVSVTATRLPDQRVLVEIHDKGIGLTAEDFAGINSKLADPPTVDASVSRQMGLFVVGRLAERHAVRVQLRPSGESAGTTSLVMIPDHLTQMPRVGEPDEQFTVSRIYAEAEPSGFPGSSGGRTASELGFDDSRYDRPQVQAPQADEAAALGAVQRSLRLGHRRSAAALESSGPIPIIQDPNAGRPQEPSYEGGYGSGEYDGGYGGEYPQQQPYAEQYGDEQYQGEQQYGGDQYLGEPYDADFPTTSFPAAAFQEQQSYPAPDASYEAGRYTAADFDSPAPQDPFAAQGYYGHEQFGHQEQQPEQYQSEAQYGHPYYAESPQVDQPMAAEFPSPQLPTPRASLPQRATPQPPAQPTSNDSLPTRRPGQALGGRAIGDRNTGEQPNWFTGAREEEGQQSPAPFTPPAPEAVRGPVAGGTTQAGLPRRVPRQNLLPGNVQEPAADQQVAAPQLGRTPEEVRGRLTNLRRGVQQGRNAGDTPFPDQHGGADLFGSPNHPER